MFDVECSIPDRRQKFSIACHQQSCHCALMPYRPKRSKKTVTKPGELESGQFRPDQFLENRRRDMVTRSTLSRLRNRKSDLK